jgi:hypothetical protein
MTYSSYSVRRTFWAVHKWEADFRGEATACGYSLGAEHACYAARSWLRTRISAATQPEPGAPIAAE